MNSGELDLLMQAVLDGEATEAETLALGTHLAADPAARQRFERLRLLYQELARLPQAGPPPGFLDAVMARVPLRSRKEGAPVQLFWKSLVFGLGSHPSRGASPGQPVGDPRISAPGPNSGERNMSEQQGKSKRNLYIGGGVAVAAAILGVAQFANFPSTGESTSGTIAPAQRFRAAQPTGSDVKLGIQGGGTNQQQPGVAGAANQASSQASNQAAGQMSNEARAAAANQAAGQMSNDARAAAANQAAGQMSNDARAAAANQAAGQMSNDARAAAANQAAGQMSNDARAAAANQAAGQMSNDARAAARNQAAGQMSNDARAAAANQAAGQMSNDARAAARNQAAGQMSNEAAQKAANQAAQKAANQAAGQVANEAMKK